MAETKTKTPKKSTAKVFDVTHPGKSAADASGRPIIVSNRPIMTDPMVSDPSADQEEPETAQALSPSVSKLVIKPLDHSEADAAEAEKTESPADPTEADKPSAEPSAQEASEPEPDQPQEADQARPDDKSKADESEPKIGAPLPIEEEEEEETPAAATETPEPTEKPAEESTNSTESTEEAPKKTDKTTKTTLMPDDDKEMPLDEKVDAETAALEAEAKKREELDKLAESRTYYLPINTIEHRRSKVATIFGTLLIIVLAAVLLDILLDAGFVTIPGVHSVTHFFSV